VETDEVAELLDAALQHLVAAARRQRPNSIG
jgi:hypothetical protein